MSGEHGPVEDGPWADKLPAQAVTPTDPPRLFGYDVHEDLAHHYRFSEVLWLAATRELPADGAADVLECALTYLLPVSVAEAPANAASVAQACQSSLASVASVGAIALAQQGQWVLERHAPLWPWLRGEVEAFPEALRGRPDEAPAVRRFASALARVSYTHRIFECSPGLHTAALAVLFDLGFREPEQLLTLWMSSRLPCVLAEAFAGGRGRLYEYPMDLPHFEYVGGERRSTAEEGSDGR